MKFLIVTQIVDSRHPVLGFFISWIKEFAKYCEKVTVICLQKGEYELQANVTVLSIGKEVGSSKIKRTFLFYKYIWQKRNDYDAVFVHMNPIYVVLGGLFWRLKRKTINLWYAHKTVSLTLRIAEKISSTIFTSTKNGFRMKSRKLKIVGQGIDTNKFKPREPRHGKNSNIIDLLNFGRISPIKDYETLIKTAELLLQTKSFPRFCLHIIGGPATAKDNAYYAKLQKIVKINNLSSSIRFLGPMPYHKIIPHIQNADLFISSSRTGSLDKTILEAMSCGVPVISSNDSMKDIFAKKQQELFTFSEGDAAALHARIVQIFTLSKEELDKIKVELRATIKQNHSLEKLINKIMAYVRD